ncbi:MAG: fluoride efflux transporter CrcB [Flavobacteriaceae bacterium]|nr:fluoride efflux transporter CrcB [Flavobacteriaceae bacterium]
MKTLLFIFIGGGLGSVFRYGLSKLLITGFLFPFGTLAVNILGSFMLGIIMGVVLKNNLNTSPFILFLTVGFCGGFTTFSAFALENLNFLKNGDYASFASYTAASLLIGILAVFIGFWISKFI